jgi:hypothetical protein
MFLATVVEKKHIFYGLYLFFQKSCHLWDNVEKYSAARLATEDKMRRRKDAICMQGNESKNTHS